MKNRPEMLALFEALLFTSARPIPRDTLTRLFGKRSRQAAEEALDALSARYSAEADDRGIVLEETEHGLRLAPRHDCEGYLSSFFENRSQTRLSRAALETLAIIAYHQEITASEIQALRGVNSAGALRTLLDEGLIRIAGRRESAGRPLLYATTREFLLRFGLRGLEELPSLPHGRVASPGSSAHGEEA